MLVRPSSFPCQPQHINTNIASEIVLVKHMGISGNAEYIYIEVLAEKKTTNNTSVWSEKK